MSLKLAPKRTADNTPPKPTSTSGTFSGAHANVPPIAPAMLRILQGLWVVILLMAIYGFYVQEAARFTNLSVATPDMVAAEQAGLPRLTPFYIITGIETMLMIIFTGVAVVLFWRRRTDWVALETGMMLTLTAFLYTGLRYTRVDGTMMMLSFLNATTETLQVSFLFIFPNGRVMPRWWRYVIAPFFGFRLIIWLYELAYNLPQQAWEIGLVAVTLATGFGYQMYRYRRLATSTQRQQQKWLLVGSAIILLTLIPSVFVLTVFQWVTLQNNFALYTVIIILRQIILTALPLALAVSILRYRLWDIDLTIHRSIVSLGVFGVLAALFGLGFVVFNALLNALFHSPSEIALVLSGMVIGFSFNATRQRVQNFVDRRFYRFRFNLLELRRADQLVIHDSAAQPGDKIGAYTVGSVLGKGGMGEVYRGQSSQHIAAIKVLPRDALGDTLMRERLEREAEALRRLDHPNIVKLLASDFSNQPAYIALEYIDGIDLSGYLKQKTALSLAETARIVLKVAGALDFCHQHGFVHRDLKPSNVMLRSIGGGQSYEPILMDFGLAKLSFASTNLTGTGAIGSINYMAPEQIQDAHQVDHRADIYALGAVVYEMLTGQCVFVGSVAQVLFAHISQPAPDARLLLPDMPSHIAVALNRALYKDPEARFQSVSAFASAFAMA